ncbi:MAG: MFS transporter, partial [Dehalococcoidia bacterium]|nr:MFS transporter [Dehalococcoidia bacterium]
MVAGVASVPRASYRRTLFAARLVVLASFIDLFAQLPVIAPYARDLGASATLVGLIVAAYSASNLVGNVLAGPILDRFGRKPVLLASMALTTLALIGYGLAQTAEQLLGVRLLHGLVIAALTPGAFALLGDAAPVNERARVFGVTGALIALAAVLGPPTASAIYSQRDDASVFFGVAAIMAVATIVVATMARDTSRQHASDDEGGNLFGLFTRLKVLVGFGAAFVLQLGLGAVTAHLAILLVDRGEGRFASGAALSVFAVVAMIGLAGPASRLADIYGRAKPLAAGFAICGLGLGALAMAPSMPLVYAAMGLFGLGFGFLFPAATALIADGCANNERGAG